MEGLRMSTSWLAAARLPSSCANKTFRSLSTRTYCRTVGQTSLNRRAIALPSRSRECTSQLRHATTNAQVLDVEARAEKWKSMEKRQVPDLNLEYVKIKGPDGGAYHPVFLRDACTCSKCRNPSTTQKNFQTTDIPATIRAESVETQGNGDVTITWENDIPGFGPDHVSTYPAKFFSIVKNTGGRLRDRSENIRPRLWNASRITEDLQYIDYDSYMKDDKYLFQALKNLHSNGLLILRGVPKSEKSVAEIAGRIGTIRDTFYGRTWDVKSVPEAKNVAYTHQYLGLHMDLLYMQNPPGFQFLHCINNSCEGGASLFSDTFYATARLADDDVNVLEETKLAYHYRNAGEHYYYERPVLEMKDKNNQVNGKYGSRRVAKFVNYSPPFQADLPIPSAAQGYLAPKLLRSLRKFAQLVETPEAVYEYRLQEGECVIFNNRRVLHGRRQFEAVGGERWLKGTYVDTDVFNSKWRVLKERYRSLEKEGTFAEDAKFVHPERHQQAVLRNEIETRMKKAARIEPNTLAVPAEVVDIKS